MGLREFIEPRPDEVNVGRVARVIMRLVVRWVNEDEFSRFLSQSDARLRVVGSERRREEKEKLTKLAVPLLNT